MSSCAAIPNPSMPYFTSSQMQVPPEMLVETVRSSAQPGFARVWLVGLGFRGFLYGNMALCRGFILVSMEYVGTFKV